MDDSQLDQMIEIGTALLGIELQDSWRPAIRMHLGISLGHAAALLEFDAPDDLDPAPVFVP